ncbi:TPM domain-containing protein [soil metagenome]
MSAETFFTDVQKETIVKAIGDAEAKTNGEIRVHIEEKCKGDVVKRAENIFGELKMQETAERSGVLFYLAIDSRVFGIYGDKGINEKVPSDFWNTISAKMEEEFRKENFTEGLCIGIAMAGEKLSLYFPKAADNSNELSNEISFR